MSSLFLFVLCLSLHAQTGPLVRLYPVDDTARDSSFRSYVGKLRSAVEDRNTTALRKLVDEEVATGPAAEDKGWQKFVEKWKPEDVRGSRLWTALADFLSLGFTREHPNLYLSPYLVWRFPDGLNRAAHLVVVRDKAPLREAPSLDAKAVALLSFDIVRQLGRPDDGGGLVRWVRVSTLDGRSGFMSMRDVMSPMMPRAQFGQRRGRWLLIALESDE